MLYIVFSAVCVGALALMGDFGTALVFFATFLVISFMRSGNFATVGLALTGAGLAGFLALSVKPHIAARFATWGHVWADVNGTGYQQTRAMSAAASGVICPAISSEAQSGGSASHTFSMPKRERSSFEKLFVCRSMSPLPE